MKVRYKGTGKIEYNGKQYHNNSIIDIKDISKIDLNQFEYIKENKPHIELKDVQGLITKIEMEIDSLKDYLKEQKTREKDLLNKLKTRIVKEIIKEVE